MRVQTVVQHHPARAHLLPSLLAALPPGAQVVEDPGAGDPRRSPWRGYLACLRALEPDASHLLVVQDDVEPCRDLAEAVDRIARRLPSAPCALFVPGLGNHGRRVLDACAAGKRYVQLDCRNNFVPCCAILWPRESVGSILALEAERLFPPERTADDGNLAAWAVAAGATILATVPSLVEHPDRELSLVGKHHMSGKNPSRIAACWIGPEMSALDFDWLGA